MALRDVGPGGRTTTIQWFISKPCTTPGVNLKKKDPGTPNGNPRISLILLWMEDRSRESENQENFHPISKSPFSTSE